jgi:hypothetical protein
VSGAAGFEIGVARADRALQSSNAFLDLTKLLIGLCQNYLRPRNGGFGLCNLCRESSPLFMSLRNFRGESVFMRKISKLERFSDLRRPRDSPT